MEKKEESISKKEKLIDLLANSRLANDYSSYIEDIDSLKDYNYLVDIINDNGGFDIEIIYYSSAIEFLKYNDSSLKESLELAYEYGFQLQNLNSEILASLLASNMECDIFHDLRAKINEILEER